MDFKKNSKDDIALALAVCWACDHREFLEATHQSLEDEEYNVSPQHWNKTIDTLFNRAKEMLKK